MALVNWFDDSLEIATTVAHKVHKKYHTYFDVSDVVQELSIWMIKREDKVVEWLDHPLDSDEYKSGVKQLAKTLTRHADRYCRRVKAQKLGYELRDEQFYPPATVAELLPHVWKDALETHEAGRPRVSGGGNPAEGGNYIVQLFDVRFALLKLPEKDREVLRLKFYDQLNYKELSEVLNVTDSTAHRRVDSAISKLINLLGGPNPYGKRESNANV